MVGSEDPLQFFLRAYLFKNIDHGQFEIKTFPIYAPPQWWLYFVLRKV